ncbi:MAG: pyruvate dehydrogenase (acetyl-transferring), homodimeric type [Chloroflexota bacterium]
MTNLHNEDTEALELEVKEWLESLDFVLHSGGPERVRHILDQLEVHAKRSGVDIPFSANTPYINTIPVEDQPEYPGDSEIEERIESLVRWNAMAMVVKANKRDASIGGHISTFASAATLYEVGFNHFFRGQQNGHAGDLVYFQGHASPGMYSRAFVEGRLSEEKLYNFRRELAPGGGLSSYPHPWLMPDFWQFPTVSMGLGPLMSIYQARFNRYLENRGLKPKTENKVWAFLGDGETDEPESLGAISMAAREDLDNLVWVINCNLQRLDGPVRGNGKIMQELERSFRGVGWNVVKVVWASNWDSLFAKDKDGLLVKRLNELVDGEIQKYSAEGGAYMREHVFGTDPKLAALVQSLSDDQLADLQRGGHDRKKVYAAFKQAVEHKGRPTVVLVQSIKGYGLGESGEGRNIAHNVKKVESSVVRDFRDRFSVPVGDDVVEEAPFTRPTDDSPEMAYIRERRAALGGSLPYRNTNVAPLKTPEESQFEEFYAGTGDREVSTTMVFVRIISKLLRDKEIGKLIVPIIPDEARTFGMEALFRQVGIYAHAGQLYDPVDSSSLLSYRESQDGQILEEGITEAGAMSSFIAAGIAHAIHGVNTIPFFIYYSMFGFQRIGDLVWAAGDMRARGFLVGATSGRTTLNGEGLQHQDGHSHLLASTVPNVISYDPSFAFELAVVIRDGIYRMYEKQEDVFYYVTVMNENYAQPAMPDHEDAEQVKEGILKGLYKFRPSKKKSAKIRTNLLGSGTIMNEVLKAQEMLEERYDIAADVWSVTSYNELRRNALDVERWNMLHPNQEPRIPYVRECVGEERALFVAASDYVKTMPDGISRWLPGPLIALGTDGFGRSESREALRDFFEVDSRYVTLAALTLLAREGEIEFEDVDEAMNDLDIDPEKVNPRLV